MQILVQIPPKTSCHLLHFLINILLKPGTLKVACNFLRSAMFEISQNLSIHEHEAGDISRPMTHESTTLSG